MKKTTFARRTSLWLTLMAITCAPLAAQTGPGFGSLKCEQETDPVGIETPSPRFSWQLVSPERGCRQTAYRIVVAGTEKDAAAGRATMWDSGKVPGEQSLLIPYDGQPLEAAETYYWSVRVWGPDGKPSAWSPAQRFTRVPTTRSWATSRSGGTSCRCCAASSRSTSPCGGRRPMSADWASSSCFSTARRRATTSSIRPGPSSIRRRNTFRST